MSSRQQIDCSNASGSPTDDPEQHHYYYDHHRHQQERNLFVCDVCSRSFTDPSNLQRHVRTAHPAITGPRSHCCSGCGKAFATSSGLKQHQHIHSSVKPFRCEVCSKAYTQFSNLCRHKRMHADCRKQIRCNDCGQAFSTTTSLAKHGRFCSGLILQRKATSASRLPQQHTKGQARLPTIEDSHPRSVDVDMETPDSECILLSTSGAHSMMTMAGYGTSGTQSSMLTVQLGETSPSLPTRSRQSSVGLESPMTNVSSGIHNGGGTEWQTVEPEPGNRIYIKQRGIDIRLSPEAYTMENEELNGKRNSPSTKETSVNRKADLQFGICRLIDFGNKNERDSPSADVNDNDYVASGPTCPMRDATDHSVDQPLDLSVRPGSTSSTESKPEGRLTSHCTSSPPSCPSSPTSLNAQCHQLYPSTDARCQLGPFRSVVDPLAAAAALYEHEMVRKSAERFHMELIQRAAALAAASKILGISSSPLSDMRSRRPSIDIATLFNDVKPVDKIKSMTSPSYHDIAVDAGIAAGNGCFRRIASSPPLPMQPFPDRIERHSSYQEQQQLQHQQSVNFAGHHRYGCRFCGKVFPRSANLTRHLRTHTGEQPYKCRYCERSFSISSNLQRHVRNIHNRERPFSCPLCDRCFGQQTNLDRHLKKHEFTTGNSSEVLPSAVGQFSPSTGQGATPMSLVVQGGRRCWVSSTALPASGRKYRNDVDSKVRDEDRDATGGESYLSELRRFVVQTCGIDSVAGGGSENQLFGQRHSKLNNVIGDIDERTSSVIGKSATKLEVTESVDDERRRHGQDQIVREGSDCSNSFDEDDIPDDESIDVTMNDAEENHDDVDDESLPGGDVDNRSSSSSMMGRHHYQRVTEAINLHCDLQSESVIHRQNSTSIDTSVQSCVC